MKGRGTKHWIILYTTLAFLMLATHYLLASAIFSSMGDYVPLLRKLSFSIMLVFIFLIISEITKGIINKQAQTEGDRYNLLRITRFLTVICVIIIIASFLFQNLYAAAVSFGFISLVLGFALQSPIASFIAWLYIVFRRPYQVGNRIQINGLRGDVIEISYLDTIILECSGDYLGNDRKSGRVIHFPNSLILKDKVINYSGPDSPFIWNETAVVVAYTSDLKFVEDTLLQTTNDDFRNKYPNKSEQKWSAAVYFRVNAYSWMEAVVSYPVEPNDTTGRRNRILCSALPELNKSPERVQFPKGDSR